MHLKCGLEGINLVTRVILLFFFLHESFPINDINFCDYLLHHETISI